MKHCKQKSFQILMPLNVPFFLLFHNQSLPGIELKQLHLGGNSLLEVWSPFFPAPDCVKCSLLKKSCKICFQRAATTILQISFHVDSSHQVQPLLLADTLVQIEEVSLQETQVVKDDSVVVLCCGDCCCWWPCDSLITLVTFVTSIPMLVWWCKCKIWY